MLPKVSLVYVSDVNLINRAISKSRGNYVNLGNDEIVRRIRRIGIELGHESILEHSLISFDIICSRAALQEIARHRIGVSMTVRSTRYTIKKDYKEIFNRINSLILNSLDAFADHYDNLAKVYNDYVVSLTKPDFSFIGNFFSYLEKLSVNGEIWSNDKIKIYLPEYYRTEMQISFNLRSLLHFLRLRLDKSAWHELRYIAFSMLNALPEDFKDILLYDEAINKNYEELKIKLNKLLKDGKEYERAVEETFVVSV